MDDIVIGELAVLSSKEAVEFLLPKHYSGRKPQITKAFGWFINSELVAVCTFGKPASPSLCYGICGKEHSSSVYELNRLCRIDTLTEPLSQFVSACLRELTKENWIIVSYSDTGMHHNGYIYIYIYIRLVIFFTPGRPNSVPINTLKMVSTQDTMTIVNKVSTEWCVLLKTDMCIFAQRINF